MHFYMIQAAKKEDSSSLTENRKVDDSDSDSDGMYTVAPDYTSPADLSQ